MHPRALLSCLVVTASLAGSACTSGQRGAPSSTRPAWLPHSEDVRIPAAEQWGDAGWARVARDVPGGFAGLMVDSIDASRFLVFMVEPDRWPEVRDALARHPDFTGYAADPRFRRARVAPARWSFAELYAARDHLNAIGMPGVEVSSVDADEVRNRVAFGVRSEADRAAMQRRLTELGVPPDLVAIDLVGPICTAELRPAILLHVRDSVTGASIASGARVRIRSGTFADSVVGTPDQGDAAFWLGPDRPGLYDVEVRRDGYRDWTTRGVEVPGDECHASTVTLTARLQRR